MNSTVRRTLIALALISLIVFIYMIIRSSDSAIEPEITQEEEPVVEIIPPITDSVVYDGNGFSPAQIEASVDTIIEFTNSSSSDLTIEFEGRPELEMAVIPAGETSSSLPLSEVGTYEFMNANNPSQSGVIEIN